MRTRPPVEQDKVVQALRRQILDGDLRIGDRLPPRREVSRQFGISYATVQRAFDRLIADGYVSVVNGNGSYVSETPPHLFHYGLVFAGSPGQPAWRRFYTVLSREAAELTAAGPFTISTYLGVDKNRADGDYEKLLQDVTEHRLAGVFFATNPYSVAGTRIADDPRLPRVAIVAGGTPEEAGKAQWINLDYDAFFDKAMDYLAARGRRRIALITVPGITRERLAHFEQGLSRNGLESRPFWVQMGNQAQPQWAANLAMLMLNGAPGERPDALIVDDDNLVEYACMGAMEAGCGVSADLDIVAHCNFPQPSPSALSIARLGFDIRKLLNMGIDLIRRQRRHEESSPVTVLPPQFEWEVDARSTAPRPLWLDGLAAAAQAET